MSRTKIYVIVAVMTVALVGIAAMQVAWIKRMIELNVEQFDESVFAALNATASRLAQLEHLDAYVNGYSLDFIERRFARDRAGRAVTTVTRGRTRAQPVSTGVPGHAPDCTCTQCHQSRIGAGWQQFMRFNDRLLEAPLESRIEAATLDTILRQELADHGIAGDYTYGVFSKARPGFILVDGHWVVGERGPYELVSDEREQGGSLATSDYAVRLFDEVAVQPPGLLMIHFPRQSSIVMRPVWLTMAVSGLLLAIILACFAYSIFIIFRQKRLSMMKNDFISNMTHEFKTPIATISLAADSITNPKVSGSPEKLARFADIIRKENSRMNRQVEKVLQAAQIERGEFKLRPVEFDVHALLTEAAEHMALQAERRGGTVAVELAAADSVVEADRTHLANVFHNLIDNAIKYSPEAPRITVRTEDLRSGNIRVSVADEGVGLTREDQAQIFEKFFRVHTGNRHDVKGFGLGLSYVKAVAEAHGGSVGVTSVPGRGSTFHVDLPRRAAAA